MINISDFYDFLEDNRFSIEKYTNKIESHPDDIQNINSTEQLFHDIADKAKEHEIHDIEELSITLQSICTALSKDQFIFITSLSDVILLTVDHFFDYTKNLITPIANYDNELTTRLKKSLQTLSQSSRQNLEEHAQNALNTLTSQLLVSDPGNTADSQTEDSADDLNSDADYMQKLVDDTLKSEQDLLFFRSLIAELEYRFPIFEKRGERILPIALAMNKLAGNPVKPVQLEAAIYLHDVGMAFIPDQLLLNTKHLDHLERTALERHPIIMSDLLIRLGEWDEAAQIVHQHHEKMDGSGYPDSLNASQICDGAKIIAILDAFDAMTHVRSDRPFKKTILRTVNDIVKNPTQFDTGWTKIFIQVIRKHYIE